MKKFMLLILTFILFAAFLAGCQQEENPTLQIEGEIKKISISNSKEFGEINPEFFTVFEDEKIIEDFKSAFLSAESDMAEEALAQPEFDVNVVFTDDRERGFHLSLAEDGRRSTIVDIHGTGEAYFMPGEWTSELNDYVLAER